MDSANALFGSRQLPTELLQAILKFHLLRESTKSFRNFIDLRRINEFCDREVFQILVTYNLGFCGSQCSEHEYDRDFTLRYWLCSLRLTRIIDREQRDVATLLRQLKSSTSQDLHDQVNLTNLDETAVLARRIGQDEIAHLLRNKLISTISLLETISNQNECLKKCSVSIHDEFIINGEVASDSWAFRLCRAFLGLTGSSYHAVRMLSREQNTCDHEEGQRFCYKPLEYFVLLYFVYAGDLEMIRKLLTICKLKLCDQPSGARQIECPDHGDNHTPHWSRNEWHETLSACLHLATRHAERTIFEYLLSMLNLSLQPQFCFIEYNGETLLQAVAGRCASDLLELMIAHKWIVADDDLETSTGNFGIAVVRAARRPRDTPGRLETIRILCSSGRQCWIRQILSALTQYLVVKNDLETLRVIMSHTDTNDPSTLPEWSPPRLARRHYPMLRNMELHETAFGLAIESGNFEMFQYLLRNRPLLTRLWGTWFLSPYALTMTTIYRCKWFDTVYLEEMLLNTPNEHLDFGRLLAENIHVLPIRYVRVIARHIDFHAPALLNPAIPPGPSVGEATMKKALQMHHFEKAKALEEEFGIPRTAV